MCTEAHITLGGACILLFWAIRLYRDIVFKNIPSLISLYKKIIHLMCYFFKKNTRENIYFQSGPYFVIALAIFTG